MDLSLVRRWLSHTASIGELSVDGAFESYTCEDTQRAPDEPKVFGQTAIPLGRYEVAISRSPRFGIDMPLLLQVPGFQGVRIHSGNRPEDTEGCILVGRLMALSPPQVLESRLAYQSLFPKLEAVVARGDRIFITITDGSVS